MGKINQGILGGFSGRVGNVIGGSWKGIDYMRIAPDSVAQPNTEAQLNQRAKFKLIAGFLLGISSYLKIGFKNFAIRMTGVNAAMSYNLRNAIQGTYPNYTINYANALVARGELAPALNQSAASTVAGSIVFTWEDNSGEIGASGTDESLLLVYNAVKDQAVAVNQLGTRSSLTQTVTVPDSFSGDLVQCYIAFISADGKEVSNSRFAGAVTVA